MNKSFVETLMTQIIDTNMIPKVQVERSLAPILSMFLEDVLTETLKDDPDLSGDLLIISTEFPLKKSLNRQSTNIDWLMYNVDRKQLLFVELKTSDSSITSKQMNIYLSKQREVLRKGGSILIEDLVKLKDASRKKEKYQYLERKVSRFTNEIASCHDLRIIYILPKHSIHKINASADHVLSFSMLSASITGAFADEWQIIQSYLSELDGLSKVSTNRGFGSDPDFNSGVNFVDKYDFERIRELCEARGDSIVVGFTGGLNKLEASSLDYLENRRYKWDYSEGGTGKKLSRNWLPGSTFLRILNTKMKSENETVTDEINHPQRTSPYWEGTVKFPEMFELCIEHGDNILIGFTGGVEAFASSTLSALQTRSFYRWDYAHITDGKNLSDWLPGGTVIELLKDHHHFPDN